MARLLLGVTGGIAAYKSILFVRLATKAGHQVRVVQTETSQRFVAAETFRAITGAPVLTDEFEPDPMRGAFPGDPQPTHAAISHLALVENADAYVIAPATANAIAGLATGRADSLVASAYLAADCPVLVAPAMNHRMWHHPATLRNVARLREDGAILVDPGSGALASKGEHGDGRVAEPEDLLAAVEAVLAGAPSAAAVPTGPLELGPGGVPTAEGSLAPGIPQDLAGLHVLVSAGGTREPIDAVRFVGNRSSGRMGYAVAARAVARGARVTVVAANVGLPDPAGSTVVPVSTAEELRAACADAFGSADVLVMAAAVADFRPVDPAAGKIKKQGRTGMTIELEATVDVLVELSARRRPGQTLVGFAAEHGDQAIVHAREKLTRKGLDAVVVNDVSQPGIAFDATDNAVTIVTAAGDRAVARAAKERIADAILDDVLVARGR
ncbi:phosphopantothenate--cysteine ligase family flavoprotein [Patulibacter sp.]|uniref:bifunctional phosphopantothenoylcysteine decarboxylase/phosphopantothenate synthase n=1 Tax=Patulibacter sp. TaxID=1912859 RepID=UPI00272850A2|nr:bifunctional phosphopantothenoylcysteine decarboxylase/phosphopantothenate synthase [Patulibacter sp.]MDO9408568.1 bifunctional phosphopantothenoylcysteine decarboxylase/phosphopantothenate synthase [Patulibacter sp.]